MECTQGNVKAAASTMSLANCHGMVTRSKTRAQKCMENSAGTQKAPLSEDECHLDDELKVIAKKEPVTEELTCEQKHIDKQQAKKEGPNCELQAEDDKKVELTSKTVQGLLAYNGSPTQLSGELEDFAGRELASEELDCGLEPTDRKEAKSGKVPCEQETFKEELKSEDDKMAQSVPYSLDELKKDLSRIVYLKRVIGQLKACIEMADYLCQNLEQTNVERLAQLEESVTEKEHKF